MCIRDRDYRAALRRAGVELRESETPRELFERVRGLLDEAQTEALRVATQRHEAARYATAGR